MSARARLTTFSPPAAWLACAAAAAVLLSLASLHGLSPEFDPAWRVVSEYADGGYRWVLSLMFAAWAVSLSALAFAIWPKAETRAGRIGVALLFVAAVGPAFASVFDLHHPLHDLAGAIGLCCLPVAASLISVNLGRTEPTAARKRALIWAANLIWISLFLFAATMALMIVTYLHAGQNGWPRQGLATRGHRLQWLGKSAVRGDVRDLGDDGCPSGISSSIWSPG